MKIKEMTNGENQTMEENKKIRPEKDPCYKKAKMQKPFPWSECGSTLFRPKEQT